MRVLVVMPGHLSTTPRMLKAADSLASHGHAVRVVSAGFLGWAHSADQRTAAARSWRWDVVEHSRERAPLLHAASGARRHLARAIARAAGANAASWWACTRALSRVHDELVSTALTERCDFVCGGSAGGLAVAEEVGRKAGVPFAVDLEDLHTAESVAPDASLYHALAARILARVLPRAAFVTTSSDCIGARYREQFDIAPAVLHNVFSLPKTAPQLAREPGPLRLYWFSQTIGPGRGIDHMLAAVEHAGIAADVTLRGHATGEYLSHLRERAAAVPNLRLRIEPPADPDRMVELCAGHDVGLSAEFECVENRQLCLTNKIFTYLLAGLPVALNDTLAQRQIAGQLGDAAFLYPSADTAVLSGWLHALASDPARLRRHREAAWQQAVRRWHWEHEAEEGQLLSLVRAATERPTTER
jgi:glycosyltransferase involved in cell wall biosynthesis